MRIIAILFIGLSVLLTPLSSSAAKGGEKGPADQAWERANEKARFKRDEAGYGDMGEYQGKKHKDKEKYRDDDDRDRDRDRDRDDDDRDRDRDRDDDDRDRDRDRDRDDNDDRDRDRDNGERDKARDKGKPAGEQSRGQFWDRMKFWDRQPAE
jgi:hypothetical protein